MPHPDMRSLIRGPRFHIIPDWQRFSAAHGASSHPHICFPSARPQGPSNSSFGEDADPDLRSAHYRSNVLHSNNLQYHSMNGPPGALLPSQPTTSMQWRHDAATGDERTFLNGLMGALTGETYAPSTVEFRCDNRSADLSFNSADVEHIVTLPAFVPRVLATPPRRQAGRAEGAPSARTGSCG